MHPQYELAGFNAGKTINLGGFQFVDGVYTHESADQTTDGLTIYLERSYYAFPAGSPALKDAQERYEREQESGVAEVPTGDAGSSDPTDPLAGDEQGQQASAAAVKEAIDALDANDDSHWTAQGLPDVSAVTDLAGEKVSRAQIEATAPGYTRASAKAAAAL